MSMGCGPGISKRPPKSKNSCIVTHAEAPDFSERHSESEGEIIGNEEAQRPLNQPQDGPSSPSPATYMDGDEETVVTNIRVTDVSVGLGRIPVGFYTTVQYGGYKWRTEAIPVSVDNDVVEWDGQILIPSNLSAAICLGVYASFEFQPMLGDGEQLRNLTITVGQLLEHCLDGLPFSFFPKEGDEPSPCSSILVTVKRRKRESSSSMSRMLDRHRSVTESLSQLENATNEGHIALSHYRKRREIRDLERSIEQFERALSISSLDHPCRAAAQSNLAMALFVRCQLANSDVPFDVPLALYCDALAARPVGHLDRPRTLIQLAAVHIARFEKRQDEVDAVQAEALLREAVDLSLTESHEQRAAISALQLHAGRTRNSVPANNQSPVDQDSASPSADEDPWSLSAELLDRFRRFGDLDDLHRAISLLDTFVRSASGPRYTVGLGNLGMALMKRFARLGELRDLEQGLSRLRDAADLIPDGNPGKSIPLHNLGSAFLTRFKHVGKPHDLDEATARLKNAVDLIPDSHPNKPALLNSLGNVFFTRFEYFAKLSELEEAILRYKDAVDLTPDGQPSKPSRLSNLGKAFKIHFERTGDLNDLEQAISTFRDAVNLAPSDHPERPSYLNCLGNTFGSRFQGLGELGDLSQAISIQADAVDIISDDHPDKPILLNDIGNSLVLRFDHLGELSDLEQAILRHEEAAERIPDGHPRKPNILNSQGNAFFKRFERTGQSGDIERAMSGYKSAVDLTPNDHLDKPNYLNNLGTALKARFLNFGELGDLEQAISIYEAAIDLTPDGDTSKPTQLNNLGKAFKARFERFFKLGDLERAISLHRDAIDLTPDTHTDKPRYLADLSTSPLARFQHLGEPNDLQQAISGQLDAIRLTPSRHPYTPAFLNQLGNIFITRFKRFKQLNDLEDAIARLRDAVDLCPDSHLNKPDYLHHLGDALFHRFECIGDTNDLEHVISVYGNAVDLTSDAHPSKASYLGDLGESLRARFERFGELRDLEQAVCRHREAVDLVPDGGPKKARLLSFLGDVLKIRFERLGTLNDLEQAISKQIHAVDLIPDGHPEKPLYQIGLGNAFQARFDRLGELSDLEQANSAYDGAIKFTPHANEPRLLNNLGNTSTHRFERFGKLSDIDEAISRHRNAVDLTPERHPHKPIFLNNIGHTCLTRFKRLGELGDLEQAISSISRAIELFPDDNPRKPILLDNIGNAFRARFERLRDPTDLERAISRQRLAVEFTPDGHPLRAGFLNNLSISFLTRFEHSKDLSDLEQVILKSGAAVDLTPDGHPIKSACLTVIGSAFLARFDLLGELCDLQQAVIKLTEANAPISEDHPNKPLYLSNLGNVFKSRFQRLGEDSDLEEAISTYELAVNLTPDGHPGKPARLNNLATTILARPGHLGQQGLLEQAILLYSQAACAPTGPTTSRFLASRNWISCARIAKHHTLLRAYSVALGLLPQLAWIGLSLPLRYRELMQGANVVREAAAAALDSGDPQTAVEWLEQGRSIVWGEMFRLRNSYEDLALVNPDHARRLQELSTALEHASAARETSPSLSGQLQDAECSISVSLEQEADKHRMLAIERDELLQEIRKLPGFERFLLHKQFAQLRASAHSGPVVILNAAENRCDALIVRADADRVLHVPLPNFTLKRSVDLQNSLKCLLGARIARGDEREGKATIRVGVSWESVLSILWKDVVKPVLDALDISTPGNLSRIFWCPTGPFAFLPVHAAGLYGTQFSEPGHKVFDFVVSSYVPTLSILAPSPNADATPDKNFRLLAVRQPESDGQLRLPGVEIELNHIIAIVQNASPAGIHLFEALSGTVEEVLSLMKEADWVHFACHGIQDTDNPTDSGLCLADQRRLKLSDVIALSRPRGRGGLAFLSACQTATGDKALSDEAIHVAAGMLFAGYGAVVGTMWSISDRLAPRVARDVYKHLFQNGRRPDYRDAALALHDAVGRLRGSNASFVQWLPFIHVGL